MLDPDSIQQYINEMEMFSDDPLEALSIKTEMYSAFIQYIADSAPEPYSTLANDILKAENVQI